MRETRTFAVLPGPGVAPRAIIPLSPKEADVLRILNKRGESTGYDVAKFSEGRISVSVVYTLIGRLQKKGLVTSRTERELVEDAIAKGTRFKLEKRYWKILNGLLIVKGGDRVQVRDEIPTAAVTHVGTALSLS